jgi:hypothetical protein
MPRLCGGTEGVVDFLDENSPTCHTSAAVRSSSDVSGHDRLTSPLVSNSCIALFGSARTTRTTPAR